LYTSKSEKMKKLMITFGLLVCAFMVINAQEQPVPKDTAIITFEKTMYDLGTIKPGSTTFEFVFTNTGKGVLQLSNVTPGCGCTHAEWPKEPIAQGGKGIIKTTYNASAVGYFTKNITVFSNAKTPVVSISFKANVSNPAETVNAATPATEQKK
jgi:hypothetical protein